MISHSLFADTPMRWVPAYFPFTHPSFELEVHTGVVTGNDTDGWTEMLGCGILRQEILDHSTFEIISKNHLWLNQFQ